MQPSAYSGINIKNEYREKKSIAKKGFFLALFGYFFLATGGIGLGQEMDAIRLAIMPIWFIAFIVPLCISFFRFPIHIMLAYLSIAVYLIFQLSRTENIDLSATKIDGFLISGLAVFSIWRVGFERYGEEFIDKIIQVSFYFLILTIIYKLNAGFWDRGVRFFLNGPNVYGWMLSLAAIFSLHRLAATKNKTYVIKFLAFFLAIIWTQSKGPLVSLIGAVFVYYFLNGKIKWLFFMSILAIPTIIFLFENELVPSRYLVFYRLFFGELEQGDFGSVGIRQLMIIDGLQIFQNNPLLGIGIGNWDSYFLATSRYGASSYPHNIIIEILSEHGLIGMILISISLILIFFHSSSIGRTIILMFGACLMFSGDMEYWRFLFAVPLAMISEQRGST